MTQAKRSSDASRSSGTRRTPGKRPRGRVIRRILLGLVGFFVLGTLAVIAAIALVPVPEPNQAQVSQTTTLYYSDGKTVLSRMGTTNRQSIPLSNVPKDVRNSFLSAEDRDFYSNSGISPKGIFRSVWVGLTGGPEQGGSTITQQYVKNLYLTQERTLTRKAKEILVSLKIEQSMSKDDILAGYLNTIYFGRGASGIQAASKAYFGVNAKDLTVSQGALLASVINAPSLYDPGISGNKTRTEARWNYVLDGMVEQGWLTKAERAKQTFPATKKLNNGVRSSGPNGWIVNAVERALGKSGYAKTYIGQDSLGLSEQEIANGGLKIVTTIDKQAQDSAVQAIKDNMPNNPKLRLGLAAVQPGDGAIRALYGGPNFDGGYNRALQAAPQLGSTMKPFTMMAALDEGIGLNQTFSGASPIYLNEFRSAGTENERRGRVVNFGGASYGTIDMRRATANSVNTYYAQLNVKVGPDATAKMAEAAGVKTVANGKFNQPVSTNYANVFGSDSATALTMANAYATIAAQGKRATPYLIASVTSANKSINYKATPDVTQTINPEVTDDAMVAMRQVLQAGTAVRAGSILGRPAAGKTGSTSDNFGAWFSGFTPDQLAASVAIYKGDGSTNPANSMQYDYNGGELTGGTAPSLVWAQFMRGALQGDPVADFPKPANIGGPPVAPPAIRTPSSSSTSKKPSPSTTTKKPTTTRPPTTPVPTPTTPVPTTPVPTDPPATTAPESGNGGARGARQQAQPARVR